MHRFLKNVILFLLPVLLFCLFFVFIAVKSGELTHTSTVVKSTMSGETELFGLGFRYEDFSYKHAMTAEKGAELLVFGTSRSMQLRGEFFDTDSFYNAGGALPYLPQGYNFLSKLPKESLPEKLVLVLDQNLFNGNTYEFDKERDTLDYEHGKIDISEYYSVTRQVINAFGEGRIDLQRTLTAPQSLVGISAVLRDAGFTSDGSYLNGTDVLEGEKVPLENVQNVLWRIANNTNHFEYADFISEDSVAEIDKILKFCKENSIEVTAFLPPYAPTINTQLINSGNYVYMQLIYPTLLPIFEQYGYELFDYTHLQETTDEMYLDGFHGSDRVYALICAKLAVESDNLAEVLNEDYLQGLFNAQGNPLTVDF